MLSLLLICPDMDYNKTESRGFLMKTSAKILSISISSFLLLAGISKISLLSKEVKEVNAVGNYTQTIDQYYSNINWDLTGSTLKTALYNKIKIGSAGWSYDGLWDAYRTTDARPDGKHLWDIYSDTSDYTFDDDRINRNYSKEGDAVNREHIIPQSSFNEAAPMKSDVHHVLPSDGYVNNRRSNFPHDDVTNVTYTSNDGCKLGTGSNGKKAFEPLPQYKGDIARIYFYFVTCYENKMSSNTFEAFDKTTYPSIKSVFLSTYLKWAKEDPVSQKEIDRNNAAYKGQGNRNPFIDCPYAVGAIWDTQHASDYGAKGEYTSGGELSISKQTAVLTIGNTTTISATTADGSGINWTTSNANVVSLSSSTSTSGNSITLTAESEGTASVTATATVNGVVISKSCSVTVSLPKVLSSISVSGQKSSFIVNRAFSFGGVVTAHYSDSSTKDVTSSAQFTGYDMSQTGPQVVIVTYSEGGVNAQTTYQITVNEEQDPGECITAEIDFTGGKSSDTDSKGNVWSVTGNYSVGTSVQDFLQMKSTDTYISNSSSIEMNPSKSITIKATLRTYGGVDGQSLVVAGYNNNGNKITTTLTLTALDKNLTEYSGTITFLSTSYKDVTIKAYSGNSSVLGISGMSVLYYEYSEAVPEIEDFAVEESPKTRYYVGNTFDPTGLVIRRYYSDETSDTLSYLDHEEQFSFEPDLSTQLSESDESIEIIYEDISYFLIISVTYEHPLTSIELENPILTYGVGDQFVKPTIVAHYQGADDKDITDEVSEFGEYDMNTVGDYQITYYFSQGENEKSVTYSFSVEVLATGISLNMNTVRLEAGEQVRLVATITPSDATVDVIWSSSDENIARVSNRGLVTAVSDGEAIITVSTSNGIQATCEVVVGQKEEKPSNKSSGCGGSIAATSAILSILAISGIAVLVAKKKEK